MKKMGYSWLWIFVLTAIYAHAHQNKIEPHQLRDVLKFGKDAFGRDCLALVFVAIYETLIRLIPIGAICISCSFGAALLISFLDAKTEFAARVVLDTLASLPGFLIALALSVFFSSSKGVLIFASLVLIFPWLTRFLESHVQILKHTEYVSAARALGAKRRSIFVTHLLPELIQLCFSVLPFLLTRLLLVETSLSYLGLGQATEHETWGRLIYQGRDYLSEAPWILASSSIPLCLTLFSLHLVTGDDRL